MMPYNKTLISTDHLIYPTPEMSHIHRQFVLVIDAVLPCTVLQATNMSQSALSWRQTIKLATRPRTRVRLHNSNQHT